MEKTTKMPNAQTCSHDWILVDAAGEALGRVATKVADLIRGKHKACFSPHVDCGDFVVVINCDKVILTGNKLEDKYYYRHSGYAGGLKSVQYKQLMEKQANFAMRKAVKGMLPKTRLGRSQINKLKVYNGAEHPHAAQKPKQVKINAKGTK